MKANMVVLTAREDNNEYIVAWYLTCILNL